MNDDKTRQQIVEKIANSANILVTVSNDPSVDALSAALGLAIMLNKLSKHTTAIFSGAIPPAITFLDPEKTFESSTDSLRDFIIALDKEKADHLRYKVDGDVVKIFITPYRTTISDKDLEFSQGDYNVELVLALGVENQTHLDSALEAHGSILHDATVITISTGQGSSSLGSIDWRDESASSLSEMLVTLADIIKGDTPLIDQQVATALLTGIVAETDRFSNTKTSSKVMTIAAQLMAAGADQQLIASKLQESHEIGAGSPPSSDAPSQPIQPSKPVKEGLAIDHGEETVIAPPAETPVVAEAYAAPEETIPEVSVPPASTPTPVSTPVEASSKIADAYALDPELSAEPTPVAPSPAPLLGGVTITPPPPPAEVTPPAAAPLPSTPPTEEISKHSYLGGSTPTFDTSMNGASQASEGSSSDIFAGGASPIGVPTSPTTSPAAMTDPVIPPADPLSVGIITPGLENRDEASRDDALAAAGAIPTSAPQPFSPAPGVVLPPPPPLPDFGALPSTMSSAYALDPIPTTPSAPQPERLGDILAEPAAPAPPVSNDPGQFKIPGQ